MERWSNGGCGMNRESKPSWSEVPSELKGALENVVGAAIADAAIAWGGYGPTATFILGTADGRRLFCKGVHPGLTPEGKQAFSSELSYYRALPELAKFGPAFHGDARFEGWHLLVLDHIERKREVPPWTDAAFRGSIAALARFHAGMPERARLLLPAAQEQGGSAGLYSADRGWKLLTDARRRSEFLSLFGDSDIAARWLDRHLPEFVAMETRTAGIGGPRSWVHLDVRSDNLLFAEGEEPLLVDFPFLACGPTLMDVAFFLPSVAGEGGPSPEKGLRLYERTSGVQFETDDIAAAVVKVAGFFATRAAQPPIPGLPRLRWVQKLQLFPSLAWITAVIGIEPPPLAKPF